MHRASHCAPQGVRMRVGQPQGSAPLRSLPVQEPHVAWCALPPLRHRGRRRCFLPALSPDPAPPRAHEAYTRSRRHGSIARHARTTYDKEGADVMPRYRSWPRCQISMATRSLINFCSWLGDIPLL